MPVVFKAGICWISAGSVLQVPYVKEEQEESGMIWNV